MAHQDEPFVMDPDLRVAIVAARKEHDKRKWLDKDWRACMSIGDKYFVKYGYRGDVEPERATQEYLFEHSRQCQAQNTPRVAKILHHFMDDDGYTMYLVMEYIKLQVAPPDMDERVHEALLWLARVPLPPNQMLGPVGGGRIRHRFFKNYEAPFEIPDLVMLDQYIQKAHNRLSPPVRRDATVPISVLGERVMFTQSDMDESNFGVDGDGRTVLMDFREIGMLPETFVAYNLGPSHPWIETLGLAGTSSAYSMAVLRESLWTSASPKLGMGESNRHVMGDAL